MAPRTKRGLPAKKSMGRSQKSRRLAKFQTVQHHGEAAPTTSEAEDSTQPSPSARRRKAGPSRLETLPAELRILVLSHIDDLNDLRAVVHASPILHQQYCLDKQRFLVQALRGTLLGTLLGDAFAVWASDMYFTSRKEHEPPVVDQGITTLLGDYNVLRSDPDAVLAQCGLEHLVSMASFYMGVAQPLLFEVPRRMNDILRKMKRGPKLGALTETERTRFLRALYRFQVFQNLFGAYLEPASRFTDIRILTDFFGAFQPWEIEEIGCINKLVGNTYNEFRARIASKDDKYHPVTGERIKLPTWTPRDISERQAIRKSLPVLDFIFLHPPFYHAKQKLISVRPPGHRSNDADNNKRQLLLDGTVARGLVQFQRVLRTSNREEQAALAQKTVDTYVGEPINDCLRWATQYRRRSGQRSEDDRREDDREPLFFSGDKEDGPPAAWTTIWGNTFSNTYGDIIPSSMQNWGYVFWDEERLLQSRGIWALEKACKELWQGHDPRGPDF